MPTLNPYLNFPGNTEEAFNFYKSVFGGEFLMVQRFKDIPEHCQVDPDEMDKIMHIALPIGKGNVLMATDATRSQPMTKGNDFCLSIDVDSEEEAAALHNGLSAGGNVTVPLGKTFWGAFFGMCTDQFGISWMVNYDYK